MNHDSDHTIVGAQSSGRAPLLIDAIGITKSFAGVRALQGCSIQVNHGEVLGVLGHNGAGKSTLMNIIVGLLGRDGGDVAIDGTAMSSSFSTAKAFELGVRCVFQELSLCSNLDAIENTVLIHPTLQGFGWRKRTEALISDALNEIFPGNKISLNATMDQISIGERQMIEIARAFVATPKRKPSLVILDEPTSSLGAVAAQQLMDYLGRAKNKDITSVLISHKLNEVIETSDRIVVMREGAVIAVRPKDKIRRDEIFELMGGTVLAADVVDDQGHVESTLPARVKSKLRDQNGDAIWFEARAGEVVGLAGLDGQGQKELLHTIFSSFDGVTDASTNTIGKAAYVAGDRQREGVFPLWSIAENIGVGALEQLGRWLVSADKERDLTQKWFSNIGVRAPNPQANIMNLSGGNQQKVLVARAFATNAGTILLNDPTRGVDLETKLEIYKRLRSAAIEQQKCVIWYSTENEEFHHCDKVYVFHHNRITDVMKRSEVAEDRLVRSSFLPVTEGEAS